LLTVSEWTFGDVVPIDAEQIEGPVDIADGFAIKDAIVVESQDCVDDGC
jgi:hypothetical protein